MTLFPWMVLLVLTTLTALYVAAEFSAVAATKTEIASLARQGNRRAEGLLRVLQSGLELDRYIAACQIGITLTSLIAGAYAQATIALELTPLFAERFNLTEGVAHSSAAVTVLVFLTAIQVVLAELIPKSLALQFPERTALFTYLPTSWSVTLYSGFIRLLNGSGFILLKPFGVEPGKHNHVHSKAEIELLLAESHQGGELSPEAHQRLRRGLRLSTRTVRQLMVPRNEIEAIESSIPPADILKRILESAYSRLPVYDGSLDHIVGTVSSKDLVSFYAEHGKIPSLERLLRPIPFVPESLRADRLIPFLQEKRTTKAVVVNEFGGVQGIVSIEDVLAELLGDVGDELKDLDPEAVVQADGTVLLPGTTSVQEAEQWLGQSWESNAATVGGHIIQHLGRLPRSGEKLEIHGVQVQILEMGPTTVRSIALTPPVTTAHETDSVPPTEEPS